MPFPIRHTPRANWHKYNGAEYFVTICTGGREHYFGEEYNGQTQLTAVGAFTLARLRWPHAKIFSLTSGDAVMKMNTDLGYVPVSFNQLTDDEAFWRGCPPSPS